jgi:hypothetical protein
MSVMTIPGLTEEEQHDLFAEVGAGVFGMIAASRHLGHASPAEALAYAHGAPTVAQDLVRWSARVSGWEDARDRLYRLADRMGLDALAAVALGDVIAKALEAPKGDR